MTKDAWLLRYSVRSAAFQVAMAEQGEQADAFRTDAPPPSAQPIGDRGKSDVFWSCQPCAWRRLSWAG